MLEVKAYRAAIKLRNIALMRAQTTFIEQLSDFEDISEDGAVAQKLDSRASKGKEEDKKLKRALDEWVQMSNEAKAESVNWEVIHSEA